MIIIISIYVNILNNKSELFIYVNLWFLINLY